MAETKIPLTTLVLGSVISGCQDPIIGDWEIASIENDGWNGLTYIYNNNYNDDTCGEVSQSLTYELSGILGVTEDLNATFALNVNYSYSTSVADCPSYDSEGEGDNDIDFDGDAEAEDDGSYSISLENGEDDLDLSCRIRDDKQNMDCSTDDDEPLNLVMAKM